MKVIFHLDLDSYFVSAARVVDSSLKGIPVVISGGERRSIISAASYEAKEKGVYVPMPFYKARKLVPNIKAVMPDFPLYTTLSAKVFEYVTKYTDQIEIASIDECFIDVTSIWKKYGSPVKLAKHIQKSIKKDLDLPVSIGISNNKFVAKMSTAINKPYGITVIKPGDFLKVTSKWEVIKYYGIGPSTAAKLNEININTIGDLAKANVVDVKEILGKRSQSLINGANGIGSDEIDSSHNELKGIGNSTTFMKFDKSNRKEILDVLSHLTHLVAHRAISRNMVGKVVSVSIKDAKIGVTKSNSKQVTLERPINKYEDIFKEVIILFDSLWKESPIKFVGVYLNQLSDVFKTTYQAALWDKDVKKSKIENIIDGVNRKLKSRSLITGKEAKLNIKRNSKQSRYLESDKILKHYDKD